MVICMDLDKYVSVNTVTAHPTNQNVFLIYKLYVAYYVYFKFSFIFHIMNNFDTYP